MRFDYDFDFAGNRTIAHNLSLGPVEDLSIAVYDRADGGPLRIDFDGNPALHSRAISLTISKDFCRLLAGNGQSGRADWRNWRFSSAEREHAFCGCGTTPHAVARRVAATLLPELFAAQARRTPDADAVVFGDER